MVEVVDDSDSANIPAGTALNNPRQWTISDVPTNIAVYLTAEQLASPRHTNVGSRTLKRLVKIGDHT